MGILDGDTDPHKRHEQEMQNLGFDETFKVPAVELLEIDGATTKRKVSTLTAMKVVESGNYTYICVAPIGTAYATSAWQCKKIDQNTAGTTLITWADGNASFDNSATDPTALTYS